MFMENTIIVIPNNLTQKIHKLIRIVGLQQEIINYDNNEGDNAKMIKNAQVALLIGELDAL